MDNEKNVDESWKDQVGKEKEEACGDDCGCGHDHGQEHEHQGPPEVNFVNYIMSMGYQAMIFLGEVPHPMTGKQDQKRGEEFVHARSHSRGKVESWKQVV